MAALVTGEAPLIAIVGPTASGKSALAVALSLALGGEVVSCDAVAVYRGLDTGAAKPSAAERAAVPHHGLDLLEPDQPTTAGDYARSARADLAAIGARGSSRRRATSIRASSVIS